MACQTQGLSPGLFLEQPERSAHHHLAMFRSDIEDLRDPGGRDVLGVDQEREAPARLDGSERFGISMRRWVAVYWVRIHDQGGEKSI